MNFAVAADGIQTTVSSYTMGSGSLTVASIPSGTPTPSSSAPILVTVIRLSTYGTSPETWCTYLCTGISSATLTGLTVVDGADAAWVAGDVVEMRYCAKHINDLETAVASITTALNSVPAGVLKGVAGVLTAALSGTDFVIPSGSITGTAGNVSGTVAIANGGTGQTTASAAYNALSPMTTLGDIEFESGANTASRLAGNTSATKKFLTQTGTGSASASPTWSTISTSDLPTITAAGGGTGLTSLTAHAVLLGEGTGNVAFATIGTAGRLLIDQGASTDPAFETMSGDATLASTGAITVAALAITYAKMQHASASTLLGNPTGSAASPSEITLGSGLSFSGTTLVASGGGSSTITLTVPANMSVTGSPLTGTGTLAISASTPNVQVFLSSGSYTIPTGATFVRVEVFGSGGGGGGGGTAASGPMYGGGGGGGGGWSEMTFRAADLTSPVTITMGAAGTGGTGAASSGANGGNGTGGGNTSFGNYLKVTNGGGGFGGTSSNGFNGVGGIGLVVSNGGGSGSVTGVPGTPGASGTNLAAGGGGAGGGVSSGGAAFNGGNSSYVMTALATYSTLTGGSTPGGAGTAGSTGTTVTDMVAPGGGGSGGAASVTASTPGGVGGAGVNYGGGGAGGGAALTTAGAGGTGGAGGAAIMMIVAW
jgi:hypothetical protein